jgi:N-acetylneuraminic acid mutarotase
MPTPRTEVAVAALDGLVYVIGGLEADGSPSAKVEVYDPATDTWSEAAPLPEARHHAAAVVWLNQLVVAGGIRANGQPSAGVYVLSRNAWMSWASMSAQHGAPAAVAHKNLYYVLSGVQAGQDGARANVGTVETFFVDFWLTIESIPTPRDHLAAAVVDSKLYAVGGRLAFDYSRNLDVNEEYNLAGAPGSWTTRARMPTARSGIAAAAVGGRIYVFGGEAPEGTFDENEAYDPETDTWETMAPMPTARHGLGAAVVGDTIYVIGGGPEPGLSVTGANEAYTPPSR